MTKEAPLSLSSVSVVPAFLWMMHALFEANAHIIRQFSPSIYFVAGNEILRECAADKSQTRERRSSSSSKKEQTHKINKHVLVCGVSTLTGLVSSHSGIQNSVKLKTPWRKRNSEDKKKRKKQLSHTHSLKPNNTKNNNLWWFKVDNFTFFLY